MPKQVVQKPQSPIPVETIQNKIYLIRGHKVMLDSDLAELYGVLTKQLTRQVRRNIERFPDDFLIQLNRDEVNNLRRQFGTSSWGGGRNLPFAFTEHGILMLSGDWLQFCFKARKRQELVPVPNLDQPSRRIRTLVILWCSGGFASQRFTVILCEAKNPFKNNPTSQKTCRKALKAVIWLIGSPNRFIYSPEY
jgi:hypothetical protein